MSFASAAAPIALQPLGAVHPDELERAARIISHRFSTATLVLDPIEPPARAFARERKQFDADLLLDELFELRPERSLRVVGVIERDLYVAGRTFVFGYAHLTDGMALYSIERLRERFYGRAPDPRAEELRVERALVHELGHTFGAPHCEDPSCVMRVVTQLDTLDALPPDYCAGCAARVEDGLLVEPWSAEGRWERGMALFRRRSFERAALELEHAVRCAPLEPRFRHGLYLARLAAARGAGEGAARSTG